MCGSSGWTYEVRPRAGNKNVISPGMICFHLVGSPGTGFWLRGLGRCALPLAHARCKHLRVGSLHRTGDLAHCVHWSQFQDQSRNKEKRPVRRRVFFLGSHWQTNCERQVWAMLIAKFVISRVYYWGFRNRNLTQSILRLWFLKEWLCYHSIR